MKSPTKLIIACGVAGVLTFSAFPADAQRVRTFDDQTQTEGDAQMAIPGAPAPQQQQPEPQVIQQDAPPADAENDGDARPMSHRIRIHGADPPQTAAPELLSEEHTELYRGIIPGERDDVAHLKALKERTASDADPNPITWVGFQPEDERTRVFFQSPRPVQYQVQEALDEGELVVIFENAELPKTNFSRFIDARHFDRAVTRIEVSETGGGDVKVQLKMSEDVEPDISTDGEYLYFDFPHRTVDADDDARADADASQ